MDVQTRRERQAGSGGSRRDVLLKAMIGVAGAKGYRATSVGDVIAEAHSSRSTFYKNFDDKLDCFLAAYDVAAEQLLDTIVGSCEPRMSWVERVRAGLLGAIELFIERPGLARALVVEVAAAGPAGQQRRWELIGRLAELLEKGRDGEDRRLPPNTAVMAVGSALGLLLEEIQAERMSELRQRLPDLLFAVLVPYLGSRAATAEVRTPPSLTRSPSAVRR